MKRCPTCPALPGEYHRPDCYGGSVNYSDDRNRFIPPPTRRLLKWRDCGPTAAQCANRPELRRAESAGVLEVSRGD